MNILVHKDYKVAIGVLTYSATPTPAFAGFDSLTLAVTANITGVALPTGMSAGETRTLIITNGGAFTIVWNASYKCPGGTKPQLTSGSGKIDIFQIFYDGTTYYLFAVGPNMA